MTRTQLMLSGISIFLTTGCQQDPADHRSNTSHSVSLWPDGVTYEIFVQSFNDSNGDGIGDFNGMTEKLDYLTGLGIEAVWLMPIMPSPSYHKYDVTDYREVHKDYGTMTEFKTFVQEAHERDIKVVIDLVINHTGIGHSWFTKARQGDPNYRDYYIWSSRDSIEGDLYKKEVTGDSGNRQQWHSLEEEPDGAYYYAFFWGGMPDLNFDNPRVRQEIYEIGRFWLTEVGVDGFRLDAAKHIYPDDRAEDNHKLWKEFLGEMRKINEEVYLVGEVWAPTEVSAPFSQGLPALFNFDLAYSIIASVKQERSVSAVIAGSSWKIDPDADLIKGFLRNSAVFQAQNRDFINATFLSNHDQNRVGSMLDGDQKKMKLAASILLTLPGSPYIYYGEEIGMLGAKPDPLIREPFLWDIQSNDKGRATWHNPFYSTDSTVTPARQQAKDNNSLYNHYKRSIELRRSSKALTLGDLEGLEVEQTGLLAYQRIYEDQRILVFHNLTPDSMVHHLEDESLKEVFSTSGKAVINGDSIIIPGYSSLVLE